MNPELEAEVIAEIEMGKKVTAIKMLRELRGIGLKEAKDIVDSYARANQGSVASPNGSIEMVESSSGFGAKIGLTIVFGLICYFIYNFSG